MGAHENSGKPKIHHRNVKHALSTKYSALSAKFNSNERWLSRKHLYLRAGHTGKVGKASTDPFSPKREKIQQVKSNSTLLFCSVWGHQLLSDGNFQFSTHVGAICRDSVWPGIMWSKSWVQYLLLAYCFFLQHST